MRVWGVAFGSAASHPDPDNSKTNPISRQVQAGQADNDGLGELSSGIRVLAHDSAIFVRPIDDLDVPGKVFHDCAA
jgi:hypothetical protein